MLTKGTQLRFLTNYCCTLLAVEICRSSRGHQGGWLRFCSETYPYVILVMDLTKHGMYLHRYIHSTYLYNRPLKQKPNKNGAFVYPLKVEALPFDCLDQRKSSSNKKKLFETHTGVSAWLEHYNTGRNALNVKDLGRICNPCSMVGYISSVIT